MIYFVRRPDGGPIKIGTTVRLSSRIKQLRDEYGDLIVLAVLDGGRDVEQALHDRFAHLGRAGEWFEPGDDLLAFIMTEGNDWDGSDEVDPLDISFRLSCSSDHARFVRCAREVGLSNSSYARMVVLEHIKNQGTRE